MKIHASLQLLAAAAWVKIIKTAGAPFVCLIGMVVFFSTFGLDKFYYVL